jgi:hypothetical protein
MPDYNPTFRRSCETLPPLMVAKTLKAAADFASQDKTVWHRTKAIETLSRFYRIQIGRKYHLLLIWQPEVKLEILELIHRSQLETWIKRYASK